MPDETRTPWHDDDSLWLELLPVLFGAEQLAKAPTEVEQLLALLQPLAPLAAGARILDLPCGVGRHSLELAKRGFYITGVDRTAPYIELARKRAADENTAAAFQLGDMRRFRDAKSRPFDLVLNLWTSFGYFEDPADDTAAARNVFENLRPGGVFVIELIPKEVVARIFRAKTWDHFGEGAIRIEQHRVLGAFERIENSWTIFRDGKLSREVKFSHRIFSAVELRDLLESVGFTTLGIYGGLAGMPFDQNANRLVIVARRPG